MTDSVLDEVAALVEASIADNTRRAYRSDLAHFTAWGGFLPDKRALVASYLAAYAETLSVATLVRRIATISKAHKAKGLPNPCRSEIVRATLRGVKRMRQEAKPSAAGGPVSVPGRHGRGSEGCAIGRSYSSGSLTGSGDRKSSALTATTKTYPDAPSPKPVYRCKICLSQHIAASTTVP